MSTLNQYLRKAVATAAANPDAEAPTKESGILAKLFGTMVAAPVARIGEKALVRPFLPAQERLRRSTGQAEGMRVFGNDELVPYQDSDPMGALSDVGKIADTALMATGLGALGRGAVSAGARKAGSLIPKKLVKEAAEEAGSKAVKVTAEPMLELQAGRQPLRIGTREQKLLPEVTQTRATVPDVIHLGTSQQLAGAPQKVNALAEATRINALVPKASTPAPLIPKTADPKELTAAINNAIKNKKGGAKLPKAQGAKGQKQVPLSPKPQLQEMPFQLLEEAESLGLKSLEGQDVLQQAQSLKDKFLELSKAWPEKQRMEDYKLLLNLLGESQ